MPESFHILLPTDVFPPVAGGAGWSSLALARALQRRGHRVTAIVPRAGGEGWARREQDGVPVIEVGYRAPGVPFVQNYFRFELLWPLLRNVLVREAYRERELPVMIHAQHAQTAPAAVLAARELEIPALATIRDAWPWHYFATGLLGDRLPFDRHGAWIDWLDLIGRLGPIKGVLAAPAALYMRRHVQRRALLLAEADAVIAVSSYIRDKLAPIVAAERLHVIPNLIDIDATARIAATPESLADLPPRFLLFVGKLERNKGAHLLPEALIAARDAGAALPPLVVAGNGALGSWLRDEAATHALDIRLLPGWVDHDDVLRLMRRAEVLLFPSAWGEPLSRVLLEANAVGACIAAIDTGGTPDAVIDGVSGVLTHGPQPLGRALADLLADPARRDALRSGAQQLARDRFAESVVVPQVEALYHTLHARRRTR